MAPLVIPEKYLLEKTTKNAEKIRELIQNRIRENKKLFPNYYFW